ncbi:hypothetical protein CXF68_12190 [Tenacibaculum sp. Bg11-29]|uniref:hypothetical protein n=1 Tax=Tenacibaculum sp. Bg11-29 TaxID=2058306 RepID=UPI000C32E3F4|nr:hypothetical protein [Tenacibaculum sp. Bg11-29]PKH51393.1 hypothetical protein CXF68_12190 [Tenacibaculum sp. Bg11-29]
MKKKKNIILILFTLYTIVAIAQSNTDDLPIEKTYIHFSSNFLLTGENLYYKIYNLSQKKLSPYSKIAYVEIIDDNNKSLIKQKVKLNNGTGYGDIFIESKLKTGTYKLISYTQWSRNKQIFFENDLYIVNPFIEKQNSGTKTIQKNTYTSNKNSKYNLKINKEKFLNREKVILKIEENIKGNFSISVNKKQPINIPLKKNIRDVFNKNSYSQKISETKFLPELRGQLIQGKILQSDSISAEISNIKLGLSILGTNPFFRTSITNDLGEFYFNVSNNDSSTAFIQVLNKERGNYKIKIKNIPLYKQFKNFKYLKLDDKLMNLIDKRTEYMQIENSYHEVKKNLELPLIIEENIFDKISLTYTLSDYKQFKTVKEVIIEILNDVWLTKNKNNNYIHVRDSNLKTDTKLPSLLVVDGNIIFNHQDFMEYDTKKIKSFSLVKNKYLFGSVLYQGILYVNTFKKDFKPNSEYVSQIDILRPVSLKEYFFQMHDVPEKTKRIPDYRTQLYWNPNVDLSTKEITFYTSDISGEFEIEIEGFTQKGKPISLIKTFFVD